MKSFIVSLGLIALVLMLAPTAPANAQSIQIIPAEPSTPERIQPLPAPDVIEAEFWSSVKNSDDPGDIRLYLERYPDGAFTPLALRRLVALESVPDQLDPAPTPSPTPAKRFSRSQIRKAQEQLNVLGFDAGVEDGIMGQRTIYAISAFQGQQGVSRSGRLSDDVVRRLNSSVSDDRLATYRADKAKRQSAAAQAPTARSNTPTTRAAPNPTAPAAAPRRIVGDTYCKSSTLASGPSNGLDGRPVDCIAVQRLSSSRLKLTQYRTNTKGELRVSDWGTFRIQGDDTYYGQSGEYRLKGDLLQKILRDKPAGTYRLTEVEIN